MEKLYTVEEVALMFGLHTNTVRTYINNDMLPAYKFGPRLIRVKQSDLETFLENMQQRKQSESA
jgi:excisionase family DNA binding protein